MSDTTVSSSGPSTTAQIEVQVNGEWTALAAGSSVADLVATLGLPDRGIAVAVGGEVCPQGDWGRALSAGDTVEILTAVQGG